MVSDRDTGKGLSLATGIVLLMVGGGLVLTTLFIATLWLYPAAFLALWEGLRQLSQSLMPVDRPGKPLSLIPWLGYAVAAIGMVAIGRHFDAWAGRLAEGAVHANWSMILKGAGVLSVLFGLMALAKAVLPGPRGAGESPSAANELLARNWQKAIVAQAEAKLKRPLRIDERRFIERRGGFIALEAIEDTVKAADAAELERYLGSER